MDPRFYQVLHVASAVFLVASCFWVLSRPATSTRKQWLAITGTLSLVMLVGAMGLWAKLYQMQSLGWIWVKLVCWLILSALPGFAYRMRGARAGLAWGVVGLAVLAIFMVYWKPF